MESFGLQWVGKTEAFLEAEIPPKGELKPCKEKSINFDAAPHLFIEGDNSEVLKLLLEQYEGKIDFIYIDPPYNTGQDFIYNDRTRSHAEWLNMMVPRLILARRLLSDDGVIFISINEIEVHHLRCVMDEIFGEHNFIEMFLWTKTNTPPSLARKSRKTVEYILCYEKVRNKRRYQGESIDNGDAPLVNSSNPITELTFPAGSIHFHIPDGTYVKGKYAKTELLDDVIVQDGRNQNPVRLRGAFKWRQATVDEEIRNGTYFLIKSMRFSIRFQRIDSGKYKAPTNFIDSKYTESLLNRNVGVGTNESAYQDLAALDLEGLFDYPKPVSLIQYLIRFSVGKDAVILDFFAGSGTTAEAVMALNEEDGGTRRFICVQLPESTSFDSKAYQAGFSTISELTLERIRRAMAKYSNSTMPCGVKVYQFCPKT